MNQACIIQPEKQAGKRVESTEYRYQIVAQKHATDSTGYIIKDKLTREYYELSALQIFNHNELLTNISVEDLRLVIFAIHEELAKQDKKMMMRVKLAQYIN